MTYSLTKSKVLSGLQCSKRLFLETHHPELAEYETGVSQTMLSGQLLGEAARKLYSDGQLIGHTHAPAQALEDTRLHLLEHDGPLFEAAFSHAGVLVRSDILLKEEGGMSLIEVKSAARIKDVHLVDCAVQAWVIEQAGTALKRIDVAHVNNKFIYEGDNDYSGLLYRQEVTEAVRELQIEIMPQLERLQAVLSGERPEVEVGGRCRSPYVCPFYHHCATLGPDYPVSSLPNGGVVITTLLRDGIEDIRDIPEGRLKSDIHQRIWRVVRSGEPELTPELVSLVRELPWPRYYLDFESIQFTVPIWPGTRPYEQLPFQWSCHVEHRSNELEHREFLDLSGEPPMRVFAESLLEAVGKEGPIVVYSSFEKTVLNGLRRRYPDLAEPLNDVIARLVDMLPWVRRHYYHPDMHGSFSIKKVLPTVAPDLSYDDLEEVCDGTAAQSAYLESIAPETANTRRESLRKAMLEYCERDTLAMVALVRSFQA